MGTDEDIAVVTEQVLDLAIGHDDLAVIVADENPVGREFHDHPREADIQPARRAPS